MEYSEAGIVDKMAEAASQAIGRTEITSGKIEINNKDIEAILTLLKDTLKELKKLQQAQNSYNSQKDSKDSKGTFENYLSDPKKYSGDSIKKEVIQDGFKLVYLLQIFFTREDFFLLKIGEKDYKLCSYLDLIENDKVNLNINSLELQFTELKNIFENDGINKDDESLQGYIKIFDAIQERYSRLCKMLDDQVLKIAGKEYDNDKGAYSTQKKGSYDAWGDVRSKTLKKRINYKDNEYLYNSYDFDLPYVYLKYGFGDKVRVRSPGFYYVSSRQYKHYFNFGWIAEWTAAAYLSPYVKKNKNNKPLDDDSNYDFLQKILRKYSPDTVEGIYSGDISLKQGLKILENFMVKQIQVKNANNDKIMSIDSLIKHCILLKEYFEKVQKDPQVLIEIKDRIISVSNKKNTKKNQPLNLENIETEMKKVIKEKFKDKDVNILLGNKQIDYSYLLSISGKN